MPKNEERKSAFRLMQEREWGWDQRDEDEPYELPPITVFYRGQEYNVPYPVWKSFTDRERAS